MRRLTPSILKLVYYLFHNQRFSFLKDLRFQSILKQIFSRSFQDRFWRAQSTNSYSKCVTIRVLNRAMIFFNGLCQNNWLFLNGGLSKIRSLQGYEVLWIHNIDAICRIHSFDLYCIFFTLEFTRRSSSRNLGTS